MPTVPAADLVRLREQRQWSTPYLVVHKPETMWAGTVNDPNILQGEQNVTFDYGARVLGYTFGAFFEENATLWVGTAVGARDVGIVRARTMSAAWPYNAGTLKVAENSDIQWQDNLYLTLKDEHRIWPRFPRVDLEESSITWYKDYDIEFSDQTIEEPPVVVMGPPACAFLDAGVATVKFWGDDSYSPIGNFILNPNFADGAVAPGDHWIEQDPAGNLTLAWDTKIWQIDGRSLKWTLAPDGVNDLGINSDNITVTASTAYHLEARGYHTAGCDNIIVGVYDVTNAGWISFPLLTFNNGDNAWEKLGATFNTPVGCVSIYVTIRRWNGDSTAGNKTFYCDAFHLGIALSNPAWTFPHGTPATAATLGTEAAPHTVTWTTAGQYMVRLRIADANGHASNGYRPVFILNRYPLGDCDNEILTPGFEVDSNADGRADDWFTLGAPVVAMASTIVLHGYYSQKVTTDAGAEGIFSTSMVAPAAPANDAIAYVWIYRVGAGSDITARIQDTTAAATRASATFGAATVTAIGRNGRTWRRLDLIATDNIIPGNNHSLDVYSMAADATVFYVDNAYLKWDTTIIPDEWCDAVAGALSPYTDFEIRSMSGDFSSGGWTASFRIFAEADVEDFPEGAQVVVFAEDWYGIVDGSAFQADAFQNNAFQTERYNIRAYKHSIGGYGHREDIVFVGWIKADSVSKEPTTGEITFDAHTTHGELQNCPSFPISVDRVTTTPADWNEIYNMDLDLAAFYVGYWHSTMYEVADVLESSDDRVIKYLDIPENNIYSQLDRTVWEETIFARTLVDRQGRIKYDCNPQFLQPHERGNLDTILTLQDDDWLGKVDAKEIHEPQVSWIDASGVRVASWEKPYPVFSMAPGDAPKPDGAFTQLTNMLISDQDDMDRVAGYALANVNKAHPNRTAGLAEVTVPLQGNYRVFDIQPQEWVLFPSLNTLREARQFDAWPGEDNEILNPSFEVDSNEDGQADNWSYNVTPVLSMESTIILHESYSQQIETNAVNEGVFSAYMVAPAETTEAVAYAWVCRPAAGSDIKVTLTDTTLSVPRGMALLSTGGWPTAPAKDGVNTFYRLTISSDAIVAGNSHVLSIYSSTTTATTFYADKAFLKWDTTTVPDLYGVDDGTPWPIGTRFIPRDIGLSFDNTLGCFMASIGMEPETIGPPGTAVTYPGQYGTGGSTAVLIETTENVDGTGDQIDMVFVSRDILATSPTWTRRHNGLDEFPTVGGRNFKVNNIEIDPFSNGYNETPVQALIGTRSRFDEYDLIYHNADLYKNTPWVSVLDEADVLALAYGGVGSIDTSEYVECLDIDYDRTTEGWAYAIIRAKHSTQGYQLLGFKTVDHGLTWSFVANISTQVDGAPPHDHSGGAQCLAIMDPYSPSYMYAKLRIGATDNDWHWLRSTNKGVTWTSRMGGATTEGITLRPEQNSDDAWYDPAGAGWSIGFFNQVGRDIGNNCCAFAVRYPSAGIGQGANINTAHAHIKAFTSGQLNGAMTVRITGIDESWLPTFTTRGAFDSWGTTAAFVDWAIPDFVPGTTYQSPSLTAIIQELVNRANWDSTCAIGLRFAVQPAPPAWNGRMRVAYNYEDSPTNTPRIDINYDCTALTTYPSIPAVLHPRHSRRKLASYWGLTPPSSDRTNDGWASRYFWYALSTGDGPVSMVEPLYGSYPMVYITDVQGTDPDYIAYVHTSYDGETFAKAQLLPVQIAQSFRVWPWMIEGASTLMYVASRTGDSEPAMDHYPFEFWISEDSGTEWQDKTGDLNDVIAALNIGKDRTERIRPLEINIVF